MTTIVVRGSSPHVVASDGVLTHVGQHGPVPAESLVLDATGCSVVPLVNESAERAGGPSRHLAPGSPAAFAVIRGEVNPSRVGEMLLVSPRDLVAVVLEDRVVAWDGIPAAASDPGPAWLGAWTDPARDMTQFLTADGRYSETRGGRPDAYTGRFWARGDLIAYLDDTGFWAFGEQVDGTLYHAYFVLRRSPR